MCIDNLVRIDSILTSGLSEPDGVPSKEIRTLKKYEVVMGGGVVLGQNTTYRAR